MAAANGDRRQLLGETHAAQFFTEPAFPTVEHASSRPETRCASETKKPHETTSRLRIAEAYGPPELSWARPPRLALSCATTTWRYAWTRARRVRRTAVADVYDH